MPPKKKTSTAPAAKKAAPAAKKTAGRARARSDSAAITVSPNVPVVFGRVVFIKHILLFALDVSEVLQCVRNSVFPWRGVNSAWYDTIHNYMDAEIWTPIVRELPVCRTFLGDGSVDLDDEDNEDRDWAFRNNIENRFRFSIADHLFCQEKTVSDAKLWAIRFFHEKGFDLTQTFRAKFTFDCDDEECFDEDWFYCNKPLCRFNYMPLNAFGHALLAQNVPVVKLVTELLKHSVKHTVNKLIPVREIWGSPHFESEKNVSEHGPRDALHSPLFIAVTFQNAQLLEFLLSVKGIVDVASKNRATALQTMCVPWRLMKRRPDDDDEDDDDDEEDEEGAEEGEEGGDEEDSDDDEDGAVEDDEEQDEEEEEEEDEDEEEEEEEGIAFFNDEFFERSFRAMVAGPSKKVLDHVCDSPGYYEDHDEELESQTAFSLCIYGNSSGRWPDGLKYAQILVEGGASMTVRGADGSNPLHMAVRRWDFELVEWMLARGGIDPDQVVPHALTLNHQGRGFDNCRDCCDDCNLLRAGAVGPADYLFPVHCRCGRPWCDDCGSDPEVSFTYGVKFVRLLVDAGATFPYMKAAPHVYTNTCPLTVVAALNGDLDLLRTLVSRGVPIAQTYRTWRSIEKIGVRMTIDWDDEGREVSERGVPAGNISALAVALDKQNVDIARFIVDEVKCPLHWRLFGGYDKDTDAAATRLADADDAEHLAQVSALDAPSRQFVHHLRSAATTAAARRYVDDLEARLAVQFAEFAAACRSGSIKRVKAFVAEHGAARCHWPDTDAPDFVKSVKGQEQQQVVNADAFIRGGQKTLRPWVGKSQPPAALSISRADPSWTGFSKMTLQKVFCYTPAASRKGVVDFLVQQMEESAYNCL